MKNLKKFTVDIYNEIAKDFSRTYFSSEYWEKEFEKVLNRNGFKLLKFRVKKENGKNKWDCYFVQKV